MIAVEGRWVVRLGAADRPGGGLGGTRSRGLKRWAAFCVHALSTYHKQSFLHKALSDAYLSLDCFSNQHTMRRSGSILFLLALLSGMHTTRAQTPDWMWAKSTGSVSNDYSNAVCTDADGNVYITGTFQGSTITFGKYTLRNTSEGFLDFFVVKYDPQGNVMWAVSDGGQRDDYAYGICTDAQGNVFVTGYFGSPTLTIASSTLVNESGFDVLVAKYDPSGIAQWGRSGNSDTQSTTAYSYGIGADSFGNVYITGSFGYGTNISFDGNTLQNLGGYDMFLVKYDNDGNVQWANRMGGSDVDGAQAIYVDSNGNSYITGFFINQAIFGGISLVSTNIAYMEIFVAKYDSNGNCTWANYAEVPETGNYASGMGVAADEFGNAYVTGYFQYSLSFGDDTLSNEGSRGLFMAKYGIDGVPLWGRSAGGTGTDYGSGACVDPNGNVVFTGYFGSSFLNFGGFPVINSNVGYNDVFIARYDPDGNALGALGIGGPDNDYGMAVATNVDGDIHSTGYFGSYSLNFSGTVLTNSGSNDTYLAKLDRDGFVSVPTVQGHKDVRLFPNPANDHITVVSEGPTEIRVYDVAAKRVLEQRFTNTTTIDVSGVPAGLYVYELLRNGSVVKGKFIRD